MLAEDKRDVRKGNWTSKQIEHINELKLLTAKPVIYLVNLSERDYVRKKNKWYVLCCPRLDGSRFELLRLIPCSLLFERNSLSLSFFRFITSRLPKIKAWIDENNPGDLLIPFSVALEERLVPLSWDEQGEELEKLGLPKAVGRGQTPGLGKITTAGYNALRFVKRFSSLHLLFFFFSNSCGVTPCFCFANVPFC